MTFDFEELDYRPTPIGALSLRRRRELKLGVDVCEIKLGDEFLMSSLFTASEIVVDIDHSPDFLLDPQNAAFYGEQGLSRLAAHLRPGGIFALWSNDRLDDAFTARLRRIFADARAEEVTFHNPLQDNPFTQTVYLAKKQAVPPAYKHGPISIRTAGAN